MSEEKCKLCEKCNDIETEEDFLTDKNGVVLCPICFDAQSNPSLDSETEPGGDCVNYDDYSYPVFCG